MFNEIRNKNILNDIIKFILFLGVLFAGFWLVNNLFTKEVKAQTNEEDNYVIPDLTNAEDLGNGNFRLGILFGVNLYYNEINEFYILHGYAQDDGIIDILHIIELATYTLSFEFLSGQLAYKPGNESGKILSMTPLVVNPSFVYLNFSTNTSEPVTFRQTQAFSIDINVVYDVEYINYTFKIKLEDVEDSGDTGGGDTGGGDIDGNFNIGITGTPNEQKYNELLTLYNDGFNRLNYIEIDGINVTSEFSLAQITVYEIYDADNFQYVNEILIRQSNTNTTILRVSEISYIFYSDLASNQVQITLATSGRFQEGYEFGRSEYGIYSGGRWYSASEWSIIVSNDLDNYYQELLNTQNGILINGEWITAERYGQIQYEKGLLDNPSNDFGTLISTILLGVGTVLGIELLPNITIGAIIAVPIVFGVIAFVLGRKKE